MVDEEKVVKLIIELSNLTGWEIAVYSPGENVEGVSLGTADYVNKIMDAFEEGDISITVKNKEEEES